MPAFAARPIPLKDLPDSQNLLQSGFWATFKKQFGWFARAFVIETESETTSALSQVTAMQFPLLFLQKKIGPFSFLYCPHGPDIHIKSQEQSQFLCKLALSIRNSLPKGVIFLRFDPPWPVSADQSPLGKPFQRAISDVQVPDTVVVDISSPEEDILSQMKAKTRYNIRLALRHGVRIFEGGVADLDIWMQLVEETARRDGITHHSKAYFRELLSAEHTAGREVKLLFAEVEGQIVAALFLAIWGRQAVYLYGASSSDKRNKMPTYALQWEAMRMARGAGCTWYDLFGIPPDAAPDHRLHGLYRIKTGFGGAIVHRIGSWDYPLKPLMYAGVRKLEQLRSSYYQKARKTSRSVRPGE